MSKELDAALTKLVEALTDLVKEGILAARAERGDGPTKAERKAAKQQG